MADLRSASGVGCTRHGAVLPVLGLALPLLVAACGKPSLGPVDGGMAMRHVEKLVGFGPRPPGSEALRKTGDYILAELRKLGLDPQEQTWHDKKENVDFRNLWVQIDGDDPKAGPILGLGAHYDTKIAHGHADAAHNIEFVGAIDGAGGPAVLLELARHLVQRKNRANVWLVFFDGEESFDWDWNDERALFGSRHFVEAMSQDKERFPKGFAKRFKTFVLLDLIGDKDIKFDKDITSDSDLNELFKQTANGMGVGDRLFRWELSGRKEDGTPAFKDDHLPFRERGVAVIDLIDFRWRVPAEKAAAPADAKHYVAWWHTAADTVDKMSPWALHFTGNLVLQAMDALEGHLFTRVR